MKMILISALALGVLGTTLYQVKTGIDERQDRLKLLETEIRVTKRDIAVLEAEWAYLSRPERVAELSGRLLEMRPIGQDRILPLDAIPMRLIPKFEDAQVEDDGIARVNVVPPKDVSYDTFDDARPDDDTQSGDNARSGSASLQKISIEAVRFIHPNELSTIDALSSIIVPITKPVRPAKIAGSISDSGKETQR